MDSGGNEGDDGNEKMTINMSVTINQRQIQSNNEMQISLSFKRTASGNVLTQAESVSPKSRAPALMGVEQQDEEFGGEAVVVDGETFDADFPVTAATEEDPAVIATTEEAAHDAEEGVGPKEEVAAQNYSHAEEQWQTEHEQQEMAAPEDEGYKHSEDAVAYTEEAEDGPIQHSESLDPENSEKHKYQYSNEFYPREEAGDREQTAEDGELYAVETTQNPLYYGEDRDYGAYNDHQESNEPQSYFDPPEEPTDSSTFIDEGDTQMIDTATKHTSLPTRGWGSFNHSNRVLPALTIDTADVKQPNFYHVVLVEDEAGQDDAEDNDDYEEENLGDNFEETPWLPPTMEKAEEYRKRKTFKEGKGALCSCRTNYRDLGAGVQLYFSFLRIMILVFLFLFVLSIPSLDLYSSGTAIAQESRDFLGFYSMTLGNIGTDKGSGQKMAELNGKLISLGTAAQILTAFDFLSCLVFFFGLIFLRMEVQRVKKSKHLLTAKQFAVYVTGLPRNCKKAEIVEHFTSLYPLDKNDWKGRAPPLGKEKLPVIDVGNTDDPMYYSSWIAEVAMARRNGHRLRTYLLNSSKTTMLKRARAKMKMYAPGTSLQHGEGANPIMYEKYEKQLDKIGGEMAQITDSLAKNENAKNERDCVGAFIIFEYPESARRCLDDYASSNFRNWCKYPKYLLFKNRRLRIVGAPEPEDVLWENLDLSRLDRFFRRFFVNIAATLLIIVSFAVVISLATTKQNAIADSPKLSLCESEIPALFTNSFYNDTSSLELMRPGVFDCVNCDVQCSNIWDSAVYAVYTKTGNALQPAFTYDISACTTGCPNPASSLKCPCVDPAGSSTCSTLACSKPTPSHTCQSFKSNTIAGCYCWSTLSSQQSNVAWFSTLVSLAKDSVCSQFVSNFALGLLLQVVLSMSTLAVNSILNVLIFQLTKLERNRSSDVEASQYMSKVFVAQYFNTAVIVVLVYGRGASTYAIISFLQQFNILNGKYTDFSVDWYSVVGVQLTLTALIAVIVPHISNLLQHFLFAPFNRRKAKKAMKDSKSPYAMQQDLNQIFVGPRFDVTIRYAQVLQVIFTALTFSAGMPLMILFALFALIVAYWVDRFLLLRYYQRPPQRDERLQKKVNSILPYAMALHLSVACWMYGSPDILGGKVKSSLISSVSNQLDVSSGSVTSRIQQPNVLPLFLLFLGLCIYLIIVDLLPSEAAKDAYKILKAVVKRAFNQHLHEHNEYLDNGFTKVFERPVPRGYNPKTPSDWVLHTYNDGSSVLRRLKPKKNGSTLSPSGGKSPLSAFKKTWEIIKVNAVPSYSVSKIPRYAEAVNVFRDEFDESDNDEEEGEEQEDSGSEENEVVPQDTAASTRRRRRRSS